MDKNFAGQNLNGRSFRGQDLRGADFSGCQLKSCDFREADLTDAKFCGATLGVGRRRKLVQWLAAFTLGMVSGFLAWFFNIISISAVNKIIIGLTWIDAFVDKNDALLLFNSLYAVSVYLVLLTALKSRDWRIMVGFLTVTIIAVAGAGAGAGAETGVVAAGGSAGAGAIAGIEAGTVMTIAYLLLGWYLNRRVLQSEEPMLALLRRYALA